MSKFNLVKEHIYGSADMDYVGICPSSVLESEPYGHRPSDLLPNAKSIIVFGRRLIDGSVQTKFRAVEDHNPAGNGSYSAHSVVLAINHLCMKQTYEISQYLEKTFDCYAMPMTNNQLQAIQPEGNFIPFFSNPYKAGMPLDITKAAVMAGIGEIGWSHRLVTPDNGARVYMCAILTSMEFEEYDKPYEGEKLCDPEKCGICAQVCPTHALEAQEAEDWTVNGKTYKVGKLDANGCAVACFGFRKDINARTRAVVENEHPSDEELAAAIKKQLELPGIQCLDHIPYYHCDRCLVYCPVGNWSEKYSSRGLTKK